MPKKRPHRVQELKPTFSSNIVEAITVEEVELKTEPVDHGYDYEQIVFPSTKIYAENDENQAALEAETGLISQLEFIKTELDVDEACINELREEMMHIANDTANGNGIINKPLKKPKSKKVQKLKVKKSQKPIEPEPLEIVRDGVKMVKCLFCDVEQTRRNRSILKEHMRTHTGYAPHSCRHCPEKFFCRSSLICHVKTDHKTKKMYKCPLCAVHFFTKKDFQDHELKCVKRRSFQCHLCKVTMKRLFMHKVKSHMRRLHTGERTFQCPSCHEWFLTNSSLRSHMQIHPEIMPFKCSECKSRFTSEESKKRHENNCLNRSRLECYMCQYSHRKLSLELLQLHMRKHTGEKPHQCPHCFKFYPRPEALKHHLQRHQELYKLKCSRCHFRCVNIGELKEHEGKCKKRRYECHLCQFTKFGLSYNKFRRHFALRHIGERNAKCLACPQTFSSIKLLAYHYTDNHPHLLALICPNCYRRFTTRTARNAHFSLCMIRRLECHICKHTSTNMKTLRSHMVSKHTGEAKFHCKLCPKKFMAKFNLKIHMKTHTKMGLVKCSFCNKQFSDMKYKKKHEFRCKQVFECYLCKLTFPSFAILNGTHMRTHLGTRPYACKHCDKTFVSIRTYNLHVMAQHLHQYTFKCNACDGNIVENKDVIKHQRSCLKPIRQAVGIVYFKCGLCDAGLARVPELRRHILASECAKHPKKSNKRPLPTRCKLPKKKKQRLL